MNVLYLTTNPNVASTTRILQQWFAQPAASGARVVVRDDGDFSEWLRRAGVPALVDSMPVPNKLAPWQVGWHAWRVARFGKGAAVIHCNEHDVYPFLTALRRFLNVPVVCHVRYRLEREWALWAFAGRRQPDALLWTSRQQREDSADAIAGIVPDSKQHVIPLGFDVETYGRDGGQRESTRDAWGISADEVVVATASPLRPRKRVLDFIQMARRLAPRNPHAVFLIAGNVIAGDEDYARTVQREIAASGLGGRLRYLGYLQPIEPFYHASDVQVSTSEYETFGNSVCEAMACARPLAAYRGGSVAEVIGDAGLVVETADLDGLTDAVERLIHDAGLRRTLGQAARQRVADQFDPRRSFEQVQSIYQSIQADR